MNVLITSISKKIPLIRQVQKACNKLNLNSLVYGADANNEAIGKFFVDHFWHMPRLNDLMIDDLLNFCKSNNIRAIIPTRDGELIFFSKYKELLQKNNIYPMISNEKAIQVCFNKLVFFSEAKRIGFPVINATDRIENLTCERFVVKEQFGAGSKEIGLDLSKKEAIAHAKKLDNPIFQPFVKGDEFSIDVFVDRMGKVRGSVVRKRDLVIQGESQITTTVSFLQLEALSKQFVSALMLYGHIVLQAIVDQEGKIHIIECNPRFGGASTLSIGVGLDSFYWFLLEVSGKNLDNILFQRSKNEKRLIRYPKDWIIDYDEKNSDYFNM